MSFYNDRILPHLINLSMRNREFLPYRERVLSSAQGRVLEIGIGSSLNLPCYGSRVDEILGLEPAARLIAMAQGPAGRSRAPVTLIAGSAEAIPIDDDSIDTVVTTWTLCSSPTQCSRCAPGDASRAQTRRSVIVRRTRTFAGGKRSEMAKSADTGLEEDWRRLPPESTDPRSHRKCGIRHRPTRDRLYERT